MHSLRRTADLIGVDKAYVSRRVRARKSVNGFETAHNEALRAHNEGNKETLWIP